MRIFAFILILLLLQLSTYGLGRSLQWLLAPYIGQHGKHRLMGAAFFITNALIAGLVFQLGHAVFRWMALWMVLLLFVMYAALATFALYLLLRRFMRQKPMSRSLRLFAPLFVAALLGWSLYHAYTPVVRHAEITIDKPLEKPLRIGMASDMHLGVLFGARQLDKLADIMNREKVDIILLPGDLMDDNVKAYRAENMRPHLEKLRAPLGVYATLGNHDLFGHEREIYEEVSKAGIRVLTNESIVVDRRLLVVGRNDDLDRNRPSAEKLLENEDTSMPVLLMDHRPTDIALHAGLPIDVQVSGHVHNGQIAPANLIVRFLNRLHYGYEQIGNGHFFVTSGYGFWGVPLRLGSQSEVWIIDVAGK
ncbi:MULTISPECIES: metallophosphoesterase [unclassified Neisseria]|uniref:metallophosphoesterase n=1 Tax=unclassified Neisseria TaxID=2623750 RepID=UPI00266631CE|nr:MULTISPECIES: metallophosphoesterase [unclassified Neisseria]MDO1515246.1 metallophosphoesterase [Neisseria sp. MVDL18-041461]MDO1562606.1 metallophosphoesterase [Neisseria sp. MVDL20-010259]